jgi:hypothetical protein
MVRLLTCKHSVHSYEILGLLLHILADLKQEVDVQHMTHKEGMAIWKGLSGGILLTQAYIFVYQFNIKPSDFVTLQMDEAAEMLVVSLCSPHPPTYAYAITALINHSVHT